MDEEIEYIDIHEGHGGLYEVSLHASFEVSMASMADAIAQWARTNFEASDSEAWYSRELAYAFELERGIEVGKVDVAAIVMAETSARRRGHALLVRRKNQA